MQPILAKLERLLHEPVLDKQLRASLVLTALSISMLPENEARPKKQKLNQILDAFISQVSKEEHYAGILEHDFRGAPAEINSSCRKACSGTQYSP